jgi:hypothetical protein
MSFSQQFKLAWPYLYFLWVSHHTLAFYEATSLPLAVPQLPLFLNGFVIVVNFFFSIRLKDKGLPF